MSSSMQMIWIRMPAQRQKCKEPWIKSHSHVITMISQSAQKRQRLYTSQHLENRTMNQPSLWMEKNWKLLINSPTWEALFPEQCTLMMRSLQELLKPVWHSEDSVQMSGSEMESSLTPSWKSTRLWYFQPSCMHVRPGQYTSVMQRD